jgi:arylsulfatase A-like enzyme
VLKTPNFDRLHHESARFTNFAVSPTCSPTRAALLTGRHEFFVNVTGTVRGANEMDREATTIAQLFQAKGYKTGMFGKWHLGLQEGYAPGNRGFDETLHVPGDKQTSHFDPVMLKNGKQRQFSGYREDILFNEAMQFMENSKGTPFFCYLPTYSSHAPNQAPKEFTAPYERLASSDLPRANLLPGFYGQVANLDYNLGRLMSFLETCGLSARTLLIVINDNGGTQGVGVYNSGMRGEKGTAWRGGTRAYCFWKLGDRFSPGDRDPMCGHVDVFPTLAELCGLRISPELRAKLDGDSLLPLLEDPEAQLAKDRIQIHHRGRWDDLTTWPAHKYGHCAVRWGAYTLVKTEPCKDPDCNNCNKVLSRGKSGNENYRLTTPGQWELFDIRSDPHQDKNIAAEHPDIVKRLSEYYEKWWTQVDAQMTQKIAARRADNSKRLSENRPRRGSPDPAEIGDRRSPPCLEIFGRNSGSVRRPATAGFRISSKPEKPAKKKKELKR